jgi:hypothetical protein
VNLRYVTLLYILVDLDYYILAICLINLFMIDGIYLLNLLEKMTNVFGRVNSWEIMNVLDIFFCFEIVER